jgi:hypothetical protein
VQIGFNRVEICGAHFLERKRLPGKVVGLAQSIEYNLPFLLLERVEVSVWHPLPVLQDMQLDQCKPGAYVRGKQFEFALRHLWPPAEAKATTFSWASNQRIWNKLTLVLEGIGLMQLMAKFPASIDATLPDPVSADKETRSDADSNGPRRDASGGVAKCDQLLA